MGRSGQQDEQRQQEATATGELRAENGPLRGEIEDLLRWKKNLVNELSGLQRTMTEHERGFGHKSASSLSQSRCNDPSSADCVLRSFRRQLEEFARKLEKRRSGHESKLAHAPWLLNREQMIELNNVPGQHWSGYVRP